MAYEISNIELKLPDGEVVKFNDYPLDESFHCEDDETKIVADDLINILEDPKNDPSVSSGVNKIFLGFSSSDPSNLNRFPLWLPTNLLTQHICITGSIGSGKTSLTYRLVAGALKTFGTVVIGEAQGGNGGFSKDAAFTDLSIYLAAKLNIKTYRWPRGNCWFNPLSELENEKVTKAFFDSIVQCLNLNNDYAMFGNKIIDIIFHLLDFLSLYSHLINQPRQRIVTFRNLVELLDTINGVSLVSDTLDKHRRKLEKLNKPSDTLEEIKRIYDVLTNLDYFRLGNPEYIATRGVITLLYNMLNSEDLLHYTEQNQYGLDNQQLVKLSIDDIIKNRSLAVISQPLEDPTSKVVGAIFWDILYNKVLSKGIYKENSEREKILAIFDETDDLPTGKLGESGGFIRQRGVGLIQIMPSIRNEEKWSKLNQVCQTFISLTPALQPMTKFIYDILPPNSNKSPFYPVISSEGTGSLKLNLQFDSQYFQPTDSPAVSYRSLNDTGKYTALLVLKNPVRIFWIDLESPLLGNIDSLLQCSKLKNVKPATGKAIDYALGLSTHFS